MHGNQIGVWTFDEDAAPLRQLMGRLVVPTRDPGFTTVTHALNDWLGQNEVGDGLLTVFLRHTSASLTIQENTDPDVQADLLDALNRLAPEGSGYRHHLEGADDMPAHIKSVLAGISLQIPVVSGQLDLGTWQAVYLVEHRRGAFQRTVTLHYTGA
ncbi:secondary thiamine-phosphate synthase enzyme YjbQ [Roseibium limicola]|uniref:YjbQ family protein n=1 Tax=Roseibium limicola TaxID=2816037 RepID=A0A939J909_9HYPH|nr:secondary thiamine-phosphate synthase enzyme YjbQ [Roseibium limicola]MBO0345414.1 YjbQ family protein [Roseibium limicola]